MKKFKRIVSLGLILSLSFSCLGETDVRAKDKKPIGTVGIIDDFGEHSTGDDDYDTPSPVNTVRPTYVPTYTPLPVHTYTPVVYTPEPTEEPKFEEEVDRDPFDLKSDPCEDEEPELKVRKFRFKRPNKDYYTYYDRMQWEKKHLNVNLPKYDAKHGAVKEVTPKIKYKTINYKKGMKSVTVKMDDGAVMPLRIRGAKKIKYDSNMETMQIEKSTGKFKTLHCLDGSYDSYYNSYTIKVDGRDLKVKMKIKKPKYKLCKSYDNNFESKYTWRAVSPCKGIRRLRSVSKDILVKDAKYYGTTMDNYGRNTEGKSEYCEWTRNTFKVQGYELSYPKCPKLNGYASTCKTLALGIDKYIDTYRIPCARNMTREECCKWIRRNGKFLRSAYCIDNRGRGGICDQDLLSYCIAPIFAKAYNYSLDDKYTSNSLVFLHAYSNKVKTKYYQWLKLDTRCSKWDYEDGCGYISKGWLVGTWCEAVRCSIDVHVYDLDVKRKKMFYNEDYQL